MKTPETKLGRALRVLANELDARGLNAAGLSCRSSAANLDRTAVSIGARGARVKTLGAYYRAKDIYRQHAGKPYEE